MNTYVKGNIFNSPAKVLVNNVNTVGVMGKGVALEYKKRYPDMFECYKGLCEMKQLDIGNLYLWKKSEKWILLFPTKKHWRNPSKLEYIEKGLKKFQENWDKIGSNSIAFPRLGCGNGGLDWADVKPLMEKYMEKLPMQIFIYVDNYEDPIPEHKDVTEMEKWLAGEMGLTGYEAFKVRLKNFVAEKHILDMPNGDTYKLTEESGLINIGDIGLDDRQICEIWNWIRDAGIVKPEDLPFEYRNISEVFLEIMRRLEYVANVFVSKDGIHFTQYPNAFQYVADLGCVVWSI